jgi:hypothetical protein
MVIGSLFMKKIWPILILGILIFSSINAIAIQINDISNEKYINESIQISKPKFVDEEEFVTVQLKEGNSYLLDSGSPMLPTITRVYILPFSSKINNIDVSYNGLNKIVLSKNIKPVIKQNPIKAGIEIQENTNIYESGDFFPKEKFSYKTGGGISDNEHVTFLTVKCNPIWLKPDQNILYYCDSIDINIYYNEGKKFVTNMNEYDLVVISPKIFLSTLSRFIDHKNSHGVRAFLKDLDEIYSEYSGRDKQEQIKYFVKDAIESYNIDYVLLIGGLKHMPIRQTAVECWGGMEVPTDLYYADVYDAVGDFCTWDSNNNNIFGEFDWDIGKIDEVDLYPDVMIGRIPCHSKLDLRIILNKIIKYENSAFNQAWFDKILLLGGDTFPFHGVIEGELVTDLIAKEMNGFESVRIWTSMNNYNPISIDIETSKGVGFISYSGHGYISGFGTSPPNVEERIEYFNRHLLGMINGNKLPIVFFDACLTATLDYKWKDIIDHPGIAYIIMMKPFGGAIATIGATRVAFTNVDRYGVHAGAGYLNLHFFMNYEDGISVSEMFTKSQNDYLNYVGDDCLTLEEFILFGDPSLKTGGYN